jgi:integrase/recombinase XerD
MLLTTIRDEFVFNCECRKLASKTIANYSKQIGYLLHFLESEKGITDIEGVATRDIKQFLIKMKQAKRKANYLNDLLKAYKVYFRYAYEEGYTETLLTDKIKNVKSDKVIIQTFAEAETKTVYGTKRCWHRYIKQAI